MKINKNSISSFSGRLAAQAAAAMAIVAVLPLATSAQTPPNGWKEMQKNSVRVFYPSDLKQGESAFILVFPAQTLGDTDPKAWMEKRIAEINQGKKAQLSAVSEKNGVLVTVGRVDGKRQVFVTRAQGEQAHLLVFSASSDALFDRYALSSVGAVARSLSGESGGNSTANETKRPVGKSSRPGAPPLPAATAGPLPAASLGGARIFIKYSLSYYPSFQTNFDHLILFPDGTAFDDVPNDPMPRFDVATLRQMLKPRDIGRWKQTGSTIVLDFPGNTREPRRTLTKHPKGWKEADAKPTPKSEKVKDSPYDVYFPVIVPTQKTMMGAWKSSSLTTMGTPGGAAPMVAAGSSGDRVFRADGTYTDAKESFASATTANMGDAFKSGGDVGTYSKNKKNAAGRWRLDGPLLTMERNGQRSVAVAFVLPNWSKTDTDLMIDGDWWKRPEKK